MYTIRQIATFIGCETEYIRRLIESNGLKPMPIQSWERYYTYYQLELVKEQLELLAQRKIIFKNNEIFTTYESNFF